MQEKRRKTPLRALHTQIKFCRSLRELLRYSPVVPIPKMEFYKASRYAERKQINRPEPHIKRSCSALAYAIRTVAAAV